ncbi:hypothetical protein EIP86_001324 [Pleurotus ostreatoroseus]|nr:hypothetical protein EIP86_001324 [Pleurotus ostreatoroseus]
MAAVAATLDLAADFSMVQIAQQKSLIPMMSESQTNAVYHPLFSSPDADTVLVTKDGAHFRVHSYTLKTTSGWFRSMFSLPQKGHPSETPVVIYVDEEANIMEALLRCICGQEIPLLDSYDVVEPLLYAAEKYDMPGPPSIVRALVMTPPLLADPLRLFVLACRHGWDDEAKLASTSTLALNLHSPIHRRTLQKVSSIPLLALFDLHRRRREALRGRLNEPPFVSDGTEATCSHCGQAVAYHTWRELKYVMVLEMDVRPLGDTICEKGLLTWPEAQACWDARCTSCQRVLYDKKETLRVIRQCIDQLPKTIDVSCLHGGNEDDASSPTA